MQSDRVVVSVCNVQSNASFFFVHVKSYDKTGACVLAENEEF